MKIEVNLSLEVDPEANFLESDDAATLDVLMELVKVALYEIDDIKITYIELEKT